MIQKSYIKINPYKQVLLIMFITSSLLIISGNILIGIPVLPISFISIIITILFISNYRFIHTRKQTILYTIIFIIKCILLVYQAKYKNLPMGGSDWSVYSGRAIHIIHNIDNNAINILTANQELFTKFIALVYYFFGEIPEQINFYIFAISLVQFKYTYLACKELIEDKIQSSNVAIISMVWPIIFIFSITFLREIPIQCLFIISLYHFIKYIKYFMKKELVYSIIFSILATMMHSGMIGVVITYLLIGIMYSRKKGVSLFNPFKLMIAWGVIIITLSSPMGDSMMRKFSNVDSIQEIIDSKQRVEGDTAYIKITPNNSVDMIIQTPYRMFMFAYSPLPWQVYSFGTIMAWVLDGGLRAWIMYRLLKFFIRFKPQTPKEQAYYITFLLIISLTYFILAWGTQNYGTSMRHRAKIFPLEVILVGGYYLKLKNRLSNHRLKKIV